MGLSATVRVRANSPRASRGFAEIALVGRQQQGVVGQCNGGNFEVLRADANFPPAQLFESVRSRSAERSDVPFRQKIEQAFQPGVGADLLVNVRRSADFGEPTAALFLGADNRNHDRFRRVVQAPNKCRMVRRMTIGKNGHVICVK